MGKNSVLSYCPSEEALVVRHAFLRDAGMKVVSALTPAEARFEIQKKKRRNLLICHQLSSSQADDISRLYRRYCPEGWIVFLTGGPTPNRIPEAVDIYLPESSGPVHIVNALREGSDPRAVA